MRALLHGVRAGGLLLVDLASALARALQRGGQAASFTDGFWVVLAMWKQSRDQKIWVFVSLLAASPAFSVRGPNLTRRQLQLGLYVASCRFAAGMLQVFAGETVVINYFAL